MGEKEVQGGTRGRGEEWREGESWGGGEGEGERRGKAGDGRLGRPLIHLGSTSQESIRSGARSHMIGTIVFKYDNTRTTFLCVRKALFEALSAFPTPTPTPPPHLPYSLLSVFPPWHVYLYLRSYVSSPSISVIFTVYS